MGSITSTSALVTGFITQGSEEIEEQGIEYEELSSMNKMIVSDYFTRSTSVGTLDRQRMEVSLMGLKPSTTYTYRAYAKTRSGIFYGEDKYFTTAPDEAGIVFINDNSEKIIIGYYTLTGRLYSYPQKGLNIILYNDGSTEKIFK